MALRRAWHRVARRAGDFSSAPTTLADALGECCMLPRCSLGRCPICFCDYTPSEMIKLKCSHMLCPDCIGTPTCASVRAAAAGGRYYAARGERGVITSTPTEEPALARR